MLWFFTLLVCKLCRNRPEYYIFSAQLRLRIFLLGGKINGA